jgi:hypothetical protein
MGTVACGVQGRRLGDGRREHADGLDRRHLRRAAGIDLVETGGFADEGPKDAHSAPGALSLGDDVSRVGHDHDPAVAADLALNLRYA